MNQTLESQAYQQAFARVKSWSNETLLSVWEAATGRDASPQDGWGTNVGKKWVVLTWDEWLEILYSELGARKLSADFD